MRRPALHSFTEDQLEEMLYRHGQAMNHATDMMVQMVPEEGRFGTLDLRPAMSWGVVAALHRQKIDDILSELDHREENESMFDWETR
jgi:hypothetical protein